MNFKLFSPAVVLIMGSLVWLTVPALNSYFSNDDWVILYHNHKIPAGEWWKFFNPQTVWFYRPLQSLEFGLTWHWAKLNPWAYNIQLLTWHITSCLLGWVLLGKLVGRGLATFSIILFSVSWVYADVLFWKANFNSLQHGAGTLGTCVALITWLEKRSRIRLGLVMLGTVFTTLTKESCVSLPLVLAVVWIGWHWKEGGLEFNKTMLRRFVGDMLPAGMILGAYVVFHRLYVVNVEPSYKPGYGFVGPMTAFSQWMHGSNHVLLGSFFDPVFVGKFPGLQRWLLGFVEKGIFLVPLLLGMAIWRRALGVTLGLLILLVTQFPHFALLTYHGARYYYLPALGGALVCASVLLPGLKLLRERATLRKRLMGYGAVALTVWMVVANVVQFQSIIALDLADSRMVEKAADFIAAQESDLPEGAVVTFRGMPQSYLIDGMGGTEMVRLLTGREDLLAVAEFEKVGGGKMADLERRKNHYLLDVTSPTLEWLPIIR